MRHNDGPIVHELIKCGGTLKYALHQYIGTIYGRILQKLEISTRKELHGAFYLQFAKGSRSFVMSGRFGHIRGLMYNTLRNVSAAMVLSGSPRRR